MSGERERESGERERESGPARECKCVWLCDCTCLSLRSHKLAYYGDH